jgi:hypothetical protein
MVDDGRIRIFELLRDAAFILVIEGARLRFGRFFDLRDDFLFSDPTRSWVINSQQASRCSME